MNVLSQIKGIEHPIYRGVFNCSLVLNLNVLEIAIMAVLVFFLIMIVFFTSSEHAGH